jgi:hypothetical protein
MAKSATTGTPGSAIVSRGQGFDGGVNMRDAVTQLAPNECRKLENGVLDERGGFAKRLGMLDKGSFGAAAHRVLSIYTFYRGGVAPPQLIIHTTGGDVLYTNDPDAPTITWGTIATGQSTTEPFSFETFAGKLYMSNGVNDYAAWDGTAYTAFPTAPKGKYLRLWKDTMWVAGVTNLPDRVYSSEPGNAESFLVSAWIDIAKGDGDRIFALATDGMFLIIGKRNRAMSMSDPVTFSNRVVDFEKGFESHFSVAQFEGAIYYVSRRGICLWLGDTPSRIISGKIDSLFDPTILNLDALKFSSAYTYENRIGWTFAEVGEVRTTLQIEYYPRLMGEGESAGPFAFQRMPAQCFARWRYGTIERLFAAHNGANKVLQAFGATGQDDGVSFSSLLETGAIDLDRPTVYKYLRRVRMLGRGQFTLLLLRNFNVSIYKTFVVDMASQGDLWSPGDIWGTDAWGPQSILQETKLHPDAYFRFLTLRFTDSNPDVGTKPIPVGSRDYRLTAGEWGVYGYNMDAVVLGVRD